MEIGFPSNILIGTNLLVKYKMLFPTCLSFPLHLPTTEIAHLTASFPSLFETRAFRKLIFFTQILGLVTSFALDCKSAGNVVYFILVHCIYILDAEQAIK